MIGLGYWGRNHARALHELRKEGLYEKLVFIDKDLERVREPGERFSVHYYIDIERAIAKEDLDAVVLATPAETHHSLLTELLKEYDLDILVEKPITTTVSEAMEILEIAGKRSIMVGYIFRFHEAIARLRDHIQHGAFGQIAYIEIIRRSLREPRTDVGTILSLGIHDVDLVGYLIDRKLPARLSTLAYSFMRQNSVDDHALINMEYPNQTLAHLQESWFDPTIGKKRILTVVGSSRSAVVNMNKPGEIMFYNTFVDRNREDDTIDLRAEGEYKDVFEFEEPLKAELRHFIEESGKDKKYAADQESAALAVALSEMALESGRLKVPIDPPKWLETREWPF